MSNAAAWRPMREADLPEVGRIADVVHPDYPEALAVLAEKLALYPAGCFVLSDGVGMAGYAFSHAWRLGAPPPLDAALGALPAGADTLHLHDVALRAEARGAGAARAIVGVLAAHAAAAGLRSLSLVAVGTAGPVWARLGFVPAPGLVRGYGAAARYLWRETVRAG